MPRDGQSLSGAARFYTVDTPLPPEMFRGTFNPVIGTHIHDQFTGSCSFGEPQLEQVEAYAQYPILPLLTLREKHSYLSQSRAKIRPTFIWTRQGALWSAARIVNTALAPHHALIPLGPLPASIDMQTRDARIGS